MELITRQIPATCEIALHGDTHEGNALCHHDGIDAFVAWVRAKRNRYWVHMGDEMDAIMTDDKRYQVDTTDEPIPLRQMHAVIDRYRPIAGRCITWLQGNHSAKLARFGDLTAEICGALSIPYGTWTAKVQLTTGKDQQRVAKLFLAHGAGNVMRSNAKDEEQRRANMLASLKNRLRRKAGDCLLMAIGHTHQLLVCPPSRRLILSDDGDQLHHAYLTQGDGAADYIEPDRRWYVNTGSYLRTYALGVSGYAERAGYDPIELGHVVVRIKAGKISEVVPFLVN